MPGNFGQMNRVVYKKSSTVSCGSVSVKTTKIWNKSIIAMQDLGLDSLKSWITIVCIGGFLYQIWDATEEYLEYR